MIVVAGSLNLDVVATVARLPEAGETVAASAYAEHPGGKGANQALAARRAGGRVAMVGRVGRDEAGARLRDGLAAAGVDVSEVRAVDAPSGRALIEVDAAGANRIVVVPGANALLPPNALADLPVGEDTVLLLQREVPDETVLACAQTVARAGGQVVFNVAPVGPVDAELLACVSVLVVNESEAAHLHGGVDAAGVRSDPEAVATALAQRVKGDVVLTLGADGATFAGVSGRGRCTGHHVEVRDTTAAGDTFVGALAVRRAQGAALAEAVRFANAAGASACTRAGAQPSIPDVARIRAILDGV